MRGDLDLECVCESVHVRMYLQSREGLILNVGAIEGNVESVRVTTIRRR